MCGIFGLITSKDNKDNIYNTASNTVKYDTSGIGNKYKKYLLQCTNKLKHRGPDGTGFYQYNNVYLGHVRLSIIDPKSGNQPIISIDDNLSLCVNGEIFNYKKLRKEYNEYLYNTNSDCESILGIYSKIDKDSNDLTLHKNI